MVALDTNVLVRFLVKDDAEQTERAAVFIRGMMDTGESLYVSEIVLCELVWVLSRSYRFQRSEIGEALRRLASVQSAVFCSRERVMRALERYRLGRGDFSDYLISEEACAAGCRTVVTFDRSVPEDPGFLVL